MRINARFGEESEKQITDLTRATNASVSDVVREAVAQDDARVQGRSGRMRKFLALADTGDSGRSDIASNVKREIGAIPEEKLPR